MRLSPSVFVTISLSILFPHDLYSQASIQSRESVRAMVSEGDYRSVASGNWNKDSTWARFNAGAWVFPASPPDFNAGVITIKAGHTVAMTSSVVYDQVVVEAGGQVSIEPGVSHTLANGAGTDLTISGVWLNRGGSWTISSGATWAVNDGGTYIHNTASSISTPIDKASLSSSSTFVYRGNSSLAPASSFSGRSYGNLTFESTSGSWTCGATGGSALSVNGVLQIGAGVTWSTGGLSGPITVRGSTLISGAWTGSGNGNMGTHTFRGLFRINSGGKYSLATTGLTQGKIVFQGDLVNDGTFTTPSNRSIIFSGTSHQTIGGLGEMTFNCGCTVSNAAGVTLAGPATVQGTLELSSGILSTGPNTLTLGPTADMSETDSSRVVGRIATTRNLIQGFNENFGNLGAEIRGLGAAAGSTTVARVTGTSTALNGATSVLRFFDISPSVNSNLAAILKLHYRDCELSGTNKANLRLFRSTDAGSSWRIAGGSSSESANEVFLDSIDSFSLWTLGEPIPAPTLNSVTPSFGETGYSIPLTLKGTGFVAGVSNVVIGGTGIQLNSVSVQSATQIIVTITISSDATPGPRTISVTSGAADTATLVSAFEVRLHFNPTPSITSVNSSNGTRGRSPTIAIHGRGLVSGFTSMSFGDGIVVNPLAASGDTTLLARIDISLTAALGPRSVTAVNPPPGGGVAALPGAFTVNNPAPQLASISPTVVERGRSSWLVFAGADFVRDTTEVEPGEGVVVDSVQLGGSSSFSVKVSIAPSAATGPRDVAVRNTPPGGGVSTLGAGLSVVNPPPTILAVDPDSGMLGQVESAIVTGTGFIDGVTSISIGNNIHIDSTRVFSCSRLQVWVNVPLIATVGSTDVSVTNGPPGGGSSVLRGMFRILIPAPLLETIEPTTGISGRSLSMKITGANFVPGLTRLSFGTGITVTSLIFNSQQQIAAALSIAPFALGGLRDVTVFNPGPGGGTAVRSEAFAVNYPVPSLSSLSATAGCRGKRMTLLVNGSNFVPGVTTLDLGGGVLVDSLVVCSPTESFACILVRRDAVPGYRDAVIKNNGPGGGMMTLPNAFTVINPMPTLTNVRPNAGNLGETISMTLDGSDFVAGVSSVSVGPGITLNNLLVDTSGTRIDADVVIDPNASTGPRDVLVVNSGPGGGPATLRGAFGVMFPAPAFSSISPLGGTRGESLEVKLGGANLFANATRVDFGPGIAVNSLSLKGNSEMIANITINIDAGLGPRSVIVTNPLPGGGTARMENAFTVSNSAPLIISLDPTSGTKGEILDVILRGVNFLPQATGVNFGEGVTVDSVTVHDLTRATVRIKIAANAVVGSRDVTVTNAAPGGGSARSVGAFTITNPVPTLERISPLAGCRGQTISLTLFGKNFESGITTLDPGKDISVSSMEVCGPTQILADVSIGVAAKLGARSVKVTNASPGGGVATLAGAFAVWNPAPTLTGVSPSFGVRGQSSAVRLTGTSFIPDETTWYFGEGISVDSISTENSTEATAVITVAAGSVAGPRDVRVTNPQPGGGAATLSGVFVIVNPAPTIASVAPLSAGRGSTLKVTVVGAQFLDGVTSLTFGDGIKITDVAVRSQTELQSNVSIIPSAAPGPRTVTVMNPEPGGGSASLVNGFLITSEAATLIERDRGSVPDCYILDEAYPNPFNPSTRIQYGLPERSRVRLDVFNVLGIKIVELTNGEQPRGYHEVELRAGTLTTGVYLVRIISESLESSRRSVASRKVILMK